ncbi:AF2331 family protein [Archaeoglobus veneficus]|uniref:AF2331-like domain-containing protein n=1 Tax=Archaeoglobus veneficus (strain DSM 11195 / SNP6) TaxID=693661 RepID=F2KSY2_ARCVS|nr:AF2331 family protein [Archaeoglobus veneficus]AEA48126.1 hypothetical protein Arcve_2137 [Archaeoglobus veneficus SNP6]
MPTYVFDKEGFMKFLEKNLGEDTMVIVSSDVTDIDEASGNSYGLGKRDFYMVTIGVVADVFKEKDVDEFDEKPKYLVVFTSSDELTSEAIEKARSK